MKYDTTNECVRLFISIGPDETLKNKIRNILAVLKQNTTGRYTQDNNIHITLVFIGEIHKSRVEEVKSAMNETNFDAFELKFSQTGRFKRYGGDTVWVGFKEEPALEALHENLSNALINKGFDIDRKKFTPHITLGRQIRYKTNFEDLKRKISFEDGNAPYKMNVLKYSLMKSEVSDGKRVYTQLCVKEAN